MNTLVKTSAVMACVLLILGPALSTTIRVPDDYATIQEAIDAAVNGDTVLVAEGTYMENINFNGKAILLASNYIIDGNPETISATIIDGGSNGRVITFISGEDSTAVIVGFTIQNGIAFNGGGIYCSGSSPIIDHMIIRGNSARFGGGGIACQFGSHPTILNSRISGNSAEHGGGIWTSSSNPVIGSPDSRCNIYDNIATNEYGLGADLTVQDSRILTVYADTFSVLNPDEGRIFPTDQLNLDINTAYFSPVAADVYVSPSGDNSNDGLSPSTPFRNIWYAILKVVSSPIDSFKVNILPGIYSPSSTGERTLHTKSYVSLIGADSSSTIIDGDGQIGLIYCYQDSNFTISNLTIKNGDAPQGAGVYCYSSNPIIIGNKIIENGSILRGTGTGGGIFCTQGSNATIRDNTIAENFSYGIQCQSQSAPLIANNSIVGNFGGGIICDDRSNPTITNNIVSSDSGGWGTGISCSGNSNPIINDNIISGNTSHTAGGISCDDNSNPTISSNIITNNTASEGGRGGGIYCSTSSPTITDNIISNNTAMGVTGAFGGGIYCRDNSNPTITNNTITGNSAIGNIELTSTEAKGGGIYLENSNPVIGGSMDEGNLFRDNIALTGADLFSTGAQTIINAQYNTFNVYPVSPFYAIPIQDFDLSNGTGLNTPITQDVYVSPLGNNANDGLTEENPLLTVQYALSRVLPSSINPLTIHLAQGTYSPSTTEEVFPLSMMSFVSLQGSGPESTILDAEETNRVIYCLDIDSLTISGLRIQGGRAGSGGGIYCGNSNPAIFNNIIAKNSAIWGAGIYCTMNSNPIISNNSIMDNSTYFSPYFAQVGGGIYNDNNSSPLIIRNLIANNAAIDWGGGIACNVNSAPMIINNTISGNNGGGRGGGLQCNTNSSPIINNSILWGNIASTGPEISGSPIVTYSDIQGGWEGQGNINGDPAFINPDVGDFFLRSASPCRDAGDPNSPFDPDGTRTDIGVFYFDINGPVIQTLADTSVLEDNSLQIPLSAFDPNGDPLFYSASSDTGAVITTVNDSSLIIMPAENWFGAAEIIVVASDGTFKDGTDFILAVKSVNDPPTISGLPDTVEFTNDAATQLNIWDHVEDVETPDPVLSYDFTVSNDSIQLDFNNSTGILTIMAPNFVGTANLFVSVTDDSNATALDTMVINVDMATGIERYVNQIPDRFYLSQNYPNPFNPETEIRFALPKASHLVLRIYNTLGQEIHTLVDSEYAAGFHSVRWDGKDTFGKDVSSGVYLYKLEAGGLPQARKMSLVR